MPRSRWVQTIAVVSVCSATHSVILGLYVREGGMQSFDGASITVFAASCAALLLVPVVVSLGFQLGAPPSTRSALRTGGLCAAGWVAYLAVYVALAKLLQR
jgi:hypothetical protein